MRHRDGDNFGRGLVTDSVGGLDCYGINSAVAVARAFGTQFNRVRPGDYPVRRSIAVPTAMIPAVAVTVTIAVTVTVFVAVN